MKSSVRTVVAVAALALVVPAAALGKVSAGLPFPSNLHTVPDATQITGLRVDVPKPDCATRSSDCADIGVLNTLDGFNIQPRISVPFSGPIDLATVSSSTVFLVGPGGQRIGINQVVWEPLTNTLHAESDAQLVEATTYLVVVTKGVRDTAGAPVESTFRHDLNFGQTKDARAKAYRKALLAALPMASVAGVDPDDIATAGLITTQSVTAISRKIRSQLLASTPAPATFALGPSGERTVFPAATPITWTRQTGTSTFALPAPLPTAALFVHPGSVATVAFGAYSSPDYETAAKIIPAVGTATGTPAVQATNQVQFTLFVPAGIEPTSGWPVAIFGHGFTDSKNGAPWAVASSLARQRIASIAINVVGHGGGSAGTYTAVTPTGPVTFSAGGRGVDMDGNGTIDSTEGVSAVGAQALVGNRDGLRQTVVDLMQLVRVIQVGVDVDADGSADLDGSRIYYAGQSFGGIYGTQLLGLESAVRAGVPNVAGGPIIEVARLSPSFRPLVGISLFFRTPSLYNAVPDATFTNFMENMPLRNVPTVIDTVSGASAIQESLDRVEWAQQGGNPAAYAPHITAPVIFQFARGDKTVPNPTTSAILRACGCASRATLFRNDLAHAAIPGVPTNPHTFLTNIAVPSVAAFALQAQAQIATFFASDAALTIDPDGAGPFFETPMVGPPPEDLAFIP